MELLYKEGEKELDLKTQGKWGGCGWRNNIHPLATVAASRVGVPSHSHTHRYSHRNTRNVVYPEILLIDYSCKIELWKIEDKNKNKTKTVYMNCKCRSLKLNDVIKSNIR